MGGKKKKLFKFFYEYLLFDSPRLCDSLISVMFTVKHLNLEKNGTILGVVLPHLRCGWKSGNLPVGDTT